jgi:hypothetical protein
MVNQGFGSEYKIAYKLWAKEDREMVSKWFFNKLTKSHTS